MAFDTEHAVEQVASLPAMKTAVRSGTDLTELWPLTTAERMDNDAKYAENLQVRLTLTMARVLAGTTEVTLPDAEFVYEGADAIPGRPQEVVDALLAANDAYEQLNPYSDSHDFSLLFEAAETLTAGWSEATQKQLGEILDDCTAYIHDTDQKRVTGLDHRFAVVLVTFAQMLRVLRSQIIANLGSDSPHTGGASSDRVRHLERVALPLLPFINEFAETLGVPRICVTADQWHGLLAAFATPNGDDDPADSARVLAESLLPLAAAEWRKHREDILWDPAEAKRAAKEEDERKNKEALAAKFAHIKDDPSKPEVEL